MTFSFFLVSVTFGFFKLMHLLDLYLGLKRQKCCDRHCHTLDSKQKFYHMKISRSIPVLHMISRRDFKCNYTFIWECFWHYILRGGDVRRVRDSRRPTSRVPGCHLFRNISSNHISPRCGRNDPPNCLENSRNTDTM